MELIACADEGPTALLWAAVALQSRFRFFQSGGSWLKATSSRSSISLPVLQARHKVLMPLKQD